MRMGRMKGILEGNGERRAKLKRTPFYVKTADGHEL
jgi:hypothetical protein